MTCVAKIRCVSVVFSTCHRFCVAPGCFSKAHAAARTTAHRFLPSAPLRKECRMSASLLSRASGPQLFATDASTHTQTGI
jgi:hypothetical protein